jgi:hypothetical protein
MGYRKNKTEILDDTIKKAELEEQYLGWDDDYYYGVCSDYDDGYYCCDYCSNISSDYEYEEGVYRDGKMVDLDSISVQRKRESRINNILGEDGKARIGDFINGKL